ncbi:hypothetical protein [Desulfolucanica intricata]|uniref:hypothetical protein n=1 Tax=Desulfolucanica intricata TaxID=1285191 RepID=UPI00082A8C9F|nr:hypothetical protein [Desulfolucanica intricata]
MVNLTRAEKFMRTKEMYDNRINDLNQEKVRLSDELQAVTAEYRDTLEYEALNGEPVNGKESLLKRSEQIKIELEEIDSKIDVLEAAKNRELAEMFPAVKEYKIDVRVRAKEDYEDQIKEVQKAKAKYLAEVKKLNDINGQIKKAQNDYLECKKATGNDKWEEAPIFMINFYEGKNHVNNYEPVGINYAEIIAAHNNGKLPDWVREYLETGDETKLPKVLVR